MNIKKAFTKLAYISAGRDCDSYMSLNEMRMILEALDEPPESIGEISSRFYNENRQLKIDLDLANTELTNCGQRIYKLNEELAIANGLVKNLEEQLRRANDRPAFHNDAPLIRKLEEEKSEFVNECIRKRDRIDKYFASCEKIREILTELQRSLHV